MKDGRKAKLKNLSHVLDDIELEVVKQYFFMHIFYFSLIILHASSEAICWYGLDNIDVGMV
jgi:hypothetical protein